MIQSLAVCVLSWMFAGRLTLVLVATAVAIGPAGSASAAKLHLSDRHERFTANNEDLHDVLQQFADDVGVPITVSDTVSGRVRGRLSALSPRSFLEIVCSTYGLDWYYDGYMLYMTANGEGLSRMIAVPSQNVAALRRALDAAGVADDRFPLRVLPGQNSIMVSGPPRYVDLVAQTASSLVPAPAGSTPSTSAPSTTVYRGDTAQKVSFDN